MCAEYSLCAQLVGPVCKCLCVFMEGLMMVEVGKCLLLSEGQCEKWKKVFSTVETPALGRGGPHEISSCAILESVPRSNEKTY